ncbi:hypothetical protein EXN66_Car014008 [Channa argus]|uniref:Uncharacterized protein n=1 Tax=Channa argus TaxID=215402 RepID=A0A6G1Q740_CHAAH|nr:hypothetical protein EXN66_Car014008 [Channa argus]
MDEDRRTLCLLLQLLPHLKSRQVLEQEPDLESDSGQEEQAQQQRLKQDVSMKEFSSALGIPLNCFLPVKNYCKEISLNDDVDSLVLSPLRLMIDFGDDFINDM